MVLPIRIWVWESESGPILRGPTQPNLPIIPIWGGGPTQHRYFAPEGGPFSRFFPIVFCIISKLGGGEINVKDQSISNERSTYTTAFYHTRFYRNEGWLTKDSAPSTASSMTTHRIRRYIPPIRSKQIK